jgi:protein gp37
MATKTKIQWMSTDTAPQSGKLILLDTRTQGGTLNTLVGCSPVSPGCANCYAVPECFMKQCRSDDLGKQFAGTVERTPGGRLRFTGKVNFIPERLDAVLRDPTHKCWFVNSLSDLFHQELSDDTILRHFDVFSRAYWQEFRILTKRPERLLALNGQIPWTNNVRMGVTVEDLAHLDRIDILGRTSAIHTWISFEPWLSPWPNDPERSICRAFSLTIGTTKYSRLRDLFKAAKIECCIVGGESSRDKLLARYFSLEDAVYILEEAKSAGAHPCLKQLGTRWAIATNNYNARSNDGGLMPNAHHGGNKELWPEHLRAYSQGWPLLELQAKVS